MGDHRIQSDASLINTLVESVMHLVESGVPPEMLADSKLRLLDVVGLCLCVNGTAEMRNLQREIMRWGEAGLSSILGFGSSSAPVAALANGIMSHAEDYDDTHTQSVVHVSAAVVPAALAVAEDAGTSGSALLHAIALGNELAVRVGLGAPGQFHAAGFHTTGIVGPVGATTAASLLMGLPAETMKNALGIVASMAAGLFEFLACGASVKRVHPGWAAQSGIMAARLARGGITGPATALEGKHGLYRTHVGEAFTPDITVADLGSKWHAHDTSFKLYPCCHFLHASLDAVTALQREHGFAADDVEEMICQLPAGALPIVAEPVSQKMSPQSGYDAKFSVYFTLASRIVTGRNDISTYQPDVLANSIVRRTMGRITCRADPESEPYPKSFGATVEVILRDGRRLFRRENENRGGVSRPISQADIFGKFMANAQPALGTARARELANLLLEIDKVDDVRRISSALVAPG